ncbi:MAG: ComEC family competence protein [Ruminococcus sp.]|nr:ComEC family competence protein [Ruminococcus sp.]
MTRKSLYVAIPYIVGFIASYTLHDTNYTYIGILSSFVITATLILVFKLGVKQSILCETSFIIGFLMFSNYMVTKVEYLKKYYGSDIVFTGKVVQIDDYSSDMSSYILDGLIDGKVKAKISLYMESVDCQYGDNIYLECTAEDFTSDYLFDSKSYYNSKGVYIQGDDVHSLEIFHVDDDVVCNVIRSLQNYRERILGTFKLNMSKSGASLMSAMLFGDKSDLSKTDKSSLIRSGIGSLIAVSGLHLAILTSVLKFFLEYFEKKDLALPKSIKFIVYELFMLMFLTVVDFPISAVRTFIMLSISNMAMLLYRKPDTLNTLCITSMAMLCLQPYLIGNVSFLLSVVGVYGIGVLSPYLTQDLNLPNFVKSILSTMITTLCVMPVCLIFFDEVSIAMPLTNIVCLPLCEISLVCGFIVFITGKKVLILTKALLYLADICCKLMISICNVISKIPFSNLPTDYNVLMYLVIICVLICIVCYGIYKSKKYVAISIVSCVVILGMTIIGVEKYQDSILKVAMLGNSKYQVMVISYDGDVNVIDFSKNYKTSTYVQTYCKRQGIDNINSITMLKKAYQSMTMYNVQLKDYKVSTVNVPQGTYLRSDYSILGAVPNLINVDNSKYAYTYRDFNITVYDNETFDIVHNGETKTFIVDDFNVVYLYYLNDGFFEVRSLES